MKQFKENAFTLIELLAVIIILAIVALIATPIILNVIEDARISAGKSEANMILGGINNYCASEEMKYQLDNSYERICTSSMDKDDVPTMVNLGNATINKLVYDGEKLTTLVITSNKHKFTLCPSGTFVMDDEKCEGEIAYTCTNEDSLICKLYSQYSKDNTTGLVKDETNPNLYYYTGTNEQVSNNFLWYGGHQWRVLEFDTEANTITLITQQPLTAIQPASAVWTTEEEYNKSYINTWLNEYFWNSLDNSVKSNILNNTFNVGTSSNVEEIQTVQKVGLLDEGQYRRAGGTNSFLNIKDVFLLGSGNNSANVNEVTPMAIRPIQIPAPEGVRVVIKIYDIIINEGDGTLTNSYRLKNEEKNTSDVQVGEYINIPYNGNDNACGSDDMCTFRVVSKENEKIKVVLNGLLQETSEWADNASDNITTDDLIYTSILNGFVKNIDEKYITIGTYGVGKYEENDSYTVVQENKITANIGLPTIGEMFSGNDIDMSYPTDEEKIFVDINTIENPTVSSYYWTMNSNNGTTACYVDSNGRLNGFLLNVSINLYGVRPVIFLKNNLEFISGEGTAQSPYKLQ